MRALIAVLSLVEAARFIVTLSRNKFDYTQWRKTCLSDTELDTLAEQANTALRQWQRQVWPGKIAHL